MMVGPKSAVFTTVRARDGKLFHLEKHLARLTRHAEKLGIEKYMTNRSLRAIELFSSDLKNKYPETFDSSIPSELIYSGTKKLTQKLKSLPLDIGKLVLSPTRTYAPIIKRIFDKVDKTNINIFLIHSFL